MIKFNPEDHSYWSGDVQFDSVTTLIKTITPPFDREAVSQKVAASSGRSQEEILAEWDKKGEEGRERGTMVHSYVDDIVANINDPVLYELNIKLPEMQAFDDAWVVFRDKLNAEVVDREFIVSNAKLRCAGRVDLLLSISYAGSYIQKCIFDWKTGSFNRSNRYAKLLPPFEDLDDCELNKYSIQLSTYRLMLECDNPKETYGSGYLVHLKKDGSHFIHRAIDLRDRVASWLKGRLSS